MILMTFLSFAMIQSNVAFQLRFPPPFKKDDRFIFPRTSHQKTGLGCSLILREIFASLDFVEETTRGHSLGAVSFHSWMSP